MVKGSCSRIGVMLGYKKSEGFVFENGWKQTCSVEDKTSCVGSFRNKYCCFKPF